MKKAQYKRYGNTSVRCFKCGCFGHTSAKCKKIKLRLSRKTKKCLSCGCLGHIAAECSDKVITCFSCGEKGHLQAYCRSPMANCWNCGKQGHTTRSCPVKKPLGMCFYCHEVGHRAYECPVKSQYKTGTFLTKAVVQRRAVGNTQVEVKKTDVKLKNIAGTYVKKGEVEKTAVGNTQVKVKKTDVKLKNKTGTFLKKAEVGKTAGGNTHEVKKSDENKDDESKPEDTLNSASILVDNTSATIRNLKKTLSTQENVNSEAHSKRTFGKYDLLNMISNRNVDISKQKQVQEMVSRFRMRLSERSRWQSQENRQLVLRNHQLFAMNLSLQKENLLLKRLVAESYVYLGEPYGLPATASTYHGNWLYE